MAIQMVVHNFVYEKVRDQLLQQQSPRPVLIEGFVAG